MNSSASSSTLVSLNRLAMAMVHMSPRVPTDTDKGAKDFKLNQLRKSIAGRQITQRPIQPEHGDSVVTRQLLEMSKPDDSHLALKRPAVIGCHSNSVLSMKEISALDLHQSPSHCKRCASEHPLLMTDVPMNPFSCWRRGHRSEKFGFLLNQTIQPTNDTNDGWAMGSARQIYTSARLRLTLQNLELGLPVSVFPIEVSRYLGRTMMVAATVRWSADNANETNKSITRVLDAQFLHSTSKQEATGQETLTGEREKLYEFIKQFVQQVSGFWRGSSGLSRRNNLGILSAAVVHCSSKSDVEYLSGALNESVEQNLHFIEFGSLNPVQLQQLGLDDERFKPHGNQFAFCLFLDPMVDLVMEHV